MPVAGNDRRRGPIGRPFYFDYPAILELRVRRKEQGSRRDRRSCLLDLRHERVCAGSFPQFLGEVLGPGMNGLKGGGKIDIKRILIESALTDVGGILKS